MKSSSFNTAYVRVATCSHVDCHGYTFQNLARGDGHPRTIGLSERCVKLNRFTNITVCKCIMHACEQELKSCLAVCGVDDHNRVVLSPLEDYVNCQGEFVNASYIDVCIWSF